MECRRFVGIPRPGGLGSVTPLAKSYQKKPSSSGKETAQGPQGTPKKQIADSLGHSTRPTEKFFPKIKLPIRALF
jgi:hypothetical protein